MISIEKIVILFVIFILLHLSTRRECVAKRKYHRYTKGIQILEYKLYFRPNIKQKTFTCQCVLVVKGVEPVDGFKFDERNLNVTTLNLVKQLDNVKYPTSRSNLAGKYSLEFTNVNGSLENNLQGFYLDEYTDADGSKFQFLTTQFAPFGASFAFPSLDEPRYRAEFKITIARPKDYTCVISNAKLKKSIVKDSLIEDEFETTEKISPCSVAFTISKMKISKKMQSSIHRIVGRPKIITLQKYEYVANLIDRVYKEVENFLQITCELQNLYHVALPSNRMKFESLGSYRGIIHYKENVLMISNSTSAEIKEKSTIAIAKLIAQQWFLSYIMVDSWTYAWINEGLTMYLAYNITNKLYPYWKIHERLIINTRMTMQDDSRCCCEPLNIEVRKPSEIESKFNRISVYKGAALITMMERIIPAKVFTRGLQNLIEDKKWSTYTPRDLYRRFEAILDLNNLYEEMSLPKKLHKIMKIWESRMGYPVIRVVRKYDTNNLDYVHVSQMRFHFDDSKRKAVWPIPINYATKGYPNFNNTRPTSWITKSNEKLRIKMLMKTDWLILNNQATYYYRVNYDDKNWKIIARALRENHESIHYLNRMQIIDDAFSLAEFGMLRYSTAFDVSRYIKNEREYAPLKAMKEAYETIHKKIADSEASDKFQTFIKRSVEHIYNKVKFNWKPDDGTQSKHRNHLTVQLLFSWLCELNSKACNGRMQKFNDPLDLSLSLIFQQHELCATMHNADKNKWNKLFDKYKKSFKNRSSQMNTFYALACSQNTGSQKRLLKFVWNSDKNQLIEALKYIFFQRLFIGLDMALKFISMMFDDLISVFTHGDLEDIFIEIGASIITGDQLEQINEFFNKYASPRSLIESCISRAKANIKWREKNLRGFENNWLNKKSTATKHYNNAHVIFLISYYTTKYILC